MLRPILTTAEVVSMSFFLAHRTCVSEDSCHGHIDACKEHDVKRARGEERERDNVAARRRGTHDPILPGPPGRGVRSTAGGVGSVHCVIDTPPSLPVACSHTTFIGQPSQDPPSQEPPLQLQENKHHECRYCHQRCRRQTTDNAPRSQSVTRGVVHNCLEQREDLAVARKLARTAQAKPQQFRRRRRARAAHRQRHRAVAGQHRSEASRVSSHDRFHDSEERSRHGARCDRTPCTNSINLNTRLFPRTANDSRIWRNVPVTAYDMIDLIAHIRSI